MLNEAAFGLFGPVLFVSRSRTKEPGIKKVFGISGKGIVYSSLRSNLILVLIAILISAIVVLVTVFFHSYKASRVNPVEALRYE